MLIGPPLGLIPPPDADWSWGLIPPPDADTSDQSKSKADFAVFIPVCRIVSLPSVLVVCLSPLWGQSSALTVAPPPPRTDYSTLPLLAAPPPAGQRIVFKVNWFRLVLTWLEMRKRLVDWFIDLLPVCPVHQHHCFLSTNTTASCPPTPLLPVHHCVPVSSTAAGADGELHPRGF